MEIFRSQRLTKEQLGRLPFFPLPNIVFFPHTFMPLHFYEPRYKALAKYCLDNESPMAVTLIRPGFEKQQPSHPPVSTIAGVGDIIHHEVTPDGRYFVLLRGIERVRLVRELDSDTPFRVAEAEVVSDLWPADGDIIGRQMASARACMTDLRKRWPAFGELVDDAVLTTDDPAILANALSAALFFEPSERQSMLSCLDVGDRLDRVTHRLAQLLAASPGGERVVN